MLGILTGIGAFTFGYGKGWSYLSNTPTTCANCHVMQGHYDSWQNSTHRHVAVCNDCHLPHNHFGAADGGRQWLQSFIGIHVREFPQAHPDQAAKPAGHSRRMSFVPCDIVHQMLPEDSEGEMLSWSIVIVAWATLFGEIGVLSDA